MAASQVILSSNILPNHPKQTEVCSPEDHSLNSTAHYSSLPPAFKQLIALINFKKTFLNELELENRLNSSVLKSPDKEVFGPKIQKL